MWSPTSMKCVLLLVVGLAFILSTHCLSVHHPNEAGQGIAAPRTSFPRLADARQKSGRGLAQLAHKVISILRSTKWPKEEALGGDSRRTWSKGGPQLPALLRQHGEEEASVAKAWPEEFIVNFTTMYGAATGFLAYDWSLQRQIIYHGPDSTYCASFGTKEACQVFEFPGGTYTYIPALKQCSLSVAGVGTVPPYWTTNSEYVGVEEIPGVGLCKGFAFPPTAHFWYETVEGSLPCLFVFPDASMNYNFILDTFELGTPDEKYFDLPDYCFGDGDTEIKQVA